MPKARILQYMVNEIISGFENSLRNMKIALDLYTGKLVYYYVMRIDN